MIKKIVIFAMLLGLSVLISGCNLTGGNVQNNAIGGGGSSNGEDGIEITFVENNPPSEMFKGTEYTFAFIIQNYQMHEISNLEFKSSGFDRGLVTGIEETDTITSIPAFSDVAGPGLRTDFIYEGVVVDNFESRYPFNPKFRYCYDQTSYRQEEICVPSQNNVCSDDIVVERNVVTNGVFDFEIQRVNAIGDMIRIDFEMTNIGNGRLVDECFEPEGFSTDFSDVKARLGTEEVSCSPTGTENFIFTNGKANFFCEFGRTSDDSYPSQLYVSAKSKYEQEISLSIDVFDLSSSRVG